MFLNITTINSNQGLPNEQIHSITQDKYGRLWLAGPAGLACYNGNTIKTYDSRSGLECQGLRTLCVTKENTIWIGTDRGIEAMTISGAKKNLIFSFDWNYGIAESILVTQSFIWVGTSFGLLKLSLSGDTIILDLAEDFGLVTQVIAKDANHILAVSQKYGLVEHDGKNWKTVNKNLPAAGLVTCVTKTLDGLFLAGSNNGLYILDSTYEIIEVFSISEQNNRVTAIVVTGVDWWIAFGHLLVLASPGISKLSVINTKDIKSNMNALYIGHSGNLWIATNSAGLKKISCLRKAISHPTLIENRPALSIKEIADTKKIMIAGDGFYSIIKESQVPGSIATNNIYEFSTIFWDTCIDPENLQNIFFATENGLFISISGASPTRYKEDNNLISSPNRVLLTRNKEVWLGTISGLFRITHNEIKEVLNSHGNSFGYVYTLAIDKLGFLMIGTLGQGLWVEKDQGIVPVITDLLTEKGNTYSVVPDNNGNTLVIQEEKVIVLDNNLTGRLILKEYPIAGWSSIWINARTIAIGSNDGIIIIDIEKKQVLQRINLLLSKSDWQFTSSRSLYMDAAGNLFCGLNSGLYIIDFAKIQQYNQPPAVFLDEITWQNISPKINSKGFKVPVGKWSVNISVFTSWYVDERLARFRFKLIGFDQNWSEFKDIPGIKYNSLPPGKYELQCQSFTPLTGPGKASTIMFLLVYSPWMKFGIQPVIDNLSGSIYGLFKATGRNKYLLKENKDLQLEINERKLIEQELKRYKEELEDIVEHRTKELIIQKERAESADKMKSVFLSNMSHEIRTPLGVIIGLNQLLHQTKVDETQFDYMSKIDSAAHHLLGIINNILDIAKIESGKIELEQMPFSMQAILEDLSGFVQLYLKEKDIEFAIEDNSQSSKYFLGDPLRIKQVLINLISNAFKFTEKGKVTLSINQTTNGEVATISFAVKDTGIGLAEKQVENIFKAFTQADSGISRRYGGTGLGLNISYKFVELMGGQLEVNSEFNKGSVFYFTIPLQIGADLISANKIKKEKQNKPIYPAGFDLIRPSKILIAEDEVLNQFILRKILENEGFQIKIVNNGKECIDALQLEMDFDLILMDIQMPEMDGFAATRFIRKSMNNQALKIIGISANAFSETKDQILADGMNDFLQKPINVDELFLLLVKWIKPRVLKS